MSKKVKSWQDLEIIVRQIASALYSCNAEAKEIDGIKCDAVIEKEVDNVILIEISKENSLDKIRTDLAKFANLKPFYMHKNIYAKCIFICDTELHPSIVETAKGAYVEAISIHMMIRYLKEGGRAAIVLPDGSLTGNAQAWKVHIDTLRKNGFNLDIKNPVSPVEEKTYTSQQALAMFKASLKKSDILIIKLEAQLVGPTGKAAARSVK
jgi:hypothetical protein